MLYFSIKSEFVYVDMHNDWSEQDEQRASFCTQKQKSCAMLMVYMFYQPVNVQQNTTWHCQHTITISHMTIISIVIAQQGFA